MAKTQHHHKSTKQKYVLMFGNNTATQKYTRVGKYLRQNNQYRNIAMQNFTKTRSGNTKIYKTKFTMMPDITDCKSY